jgi:CBS domain containing-hemolysin-like protein
LDESGLSSGIVLAAALLAYAGVGLRWGKLRRADTPPWVATLRLGFIMAIAVSATAFLFSLSWMTWLWAALFGLALFVSLATFNILTARSPSWPKTWSLADLRGRRNSGSNKSAVSNQSDGGEGFRGTDLESVMGAEAHSELDERERSMIRSILRLDEYNARDVMVPRVDVVSVDVEDDLSSVVNQMLESGHSRLPVYRETIDDVVGVIYSRRLMPLLNTEPPWPPLEELMLEPFFVPETKRLSELLTEFQGRHVEMALVVDEHGGTEGLVTLEDLLEEIVGEIEDEFSKVKGPIVTTTEDGGLIVDAGLSLNDLEELVNARFDEAEVDTIGGIVYSILDKMPKPGDEVVYEGLRIKVLTTMGRRLRKLLLAVDPQTQS